MSRRSQARYFLCVLLGISLLLVFSLNFGVVKAAEIVGVRYVPDVQVNRVIQIENGGALVINDTVTLSSNIGQAVESLDAFEIGFPPECGNSLTYFFAYDASGRLETALEASANETEFYWIRISFPEPVDVSEGGSYNFSVVCVLLGLVKQDYTFFHVDFPVYPSLAVEATLCNVTVMLPVGATLESAPANLTIGIMDSREILLDKESPLEAYANVSSWAKFSAYNFLLLDVDEWRREVNIDEWGGLTVTDYYQIVNKAETAITKISFALPPNATGVSVQDVYGTFTPSKVVFKTHEGYVEVEVSLRESLKTEEKEKILIVYRLPIAENVVQRSWQDYTLNVSLLGADSWVAKRFALTVSLPEGAELQTSSKTPYHLEKEGFRVRVEFVEYNVTRFHEREIELEYRYLILWASFRPTLWVGTVAALLGGLLFTRKTSRPAAVAPVPLSSKILSRFVDAYEERRRLRSELESLEQEVRKGKLSRRRYRMLKSSLDGRLSRLQRNLAELRKEMETADSRHLERMRRLETAEAEIETLNRDIGRVEVRFRRREISAEARRRLLDEYNRIKERAENTIAEILLRLREEIR